VVSLLAIEITEIEIFYQLNQLISSFHPQRDTQAGVPLGSILSPTFYSILVYINDTPQAPGVYLGLFADDTCIYATDLEGDYVLRKLQRGLSAIKTWCERWNIKINKNKTQAINFLIALGPLGPILH
jgi:hypothetical protein